jgi:hypothetical protein
MKFSRIAGMALLAGALPILVSCAVGPPPGAVYVRTAPPAYPVEVVGVAPEPGFVWIRGYHRWENGAYVWTPGRWERPPRPRARWIEGKWNHHRNGWYWVEGRWK